MISFYKASIIKLGKYKHEMSYVLCCFFNVSVHQVWKMRVTFFPQFQDLQGKVNKSRRKLLVCQHEDPLQGNKAFNQQHEGPERLWTWLPVCPWAQSVWQRSTARAGLRGGMPLCFQVTIFMPFKAVRRFCCRPESSAEAPQESCVIVQEG